MSKKNPEQGKMNGVSRRQFLAAGSAAALGAAAQPSLGKMTAGDVTQEPAPKIASYRTLGRTGFKVSDLSMGCGSIAEPNVVRYAYDHGMNLFDSAESYGNGDSETKIGQAMEHMDRKKIFVVTKLGIDKDSTEEDLVDRFYKSLERLQTPYVDALYSHGVADASLVGNEAFHKVCDRFKAEGKLKHIGISSHGPRGEEPDSMEAVLGKAAEDGRYDVMLLSYGFVNQEEGGRVLKICKKNNVGTTIMKSMTGLLEMPVLDLENPSEQIQGWFDYLEGTGATREEAVERIKAHLERQKPEFEAALAMTTPFVKKHGIKTQDELDRKSLQFALSNHDAHTLCPSLPTFDAIDKVLPLSGTNLSSAGMRWLDEYARAFGARNCKIGCTDCASACPESVPVSTILRYAYYYSKQGREKHAMRKYARIGAANASVCLDCNGHCTAACPHGVLAQSRLFEAHGLLSLV